MAHRAISQHEMSQIRPKTSCAKLLNRGGAHSESVRDTDRTPEQAQPDPNSIMRQLRLQFVTAILRRCLGARWNSSKERRKIALQHSRPMAAIHSLFHVVPLAGAITLLVLQWTSSWASATNNYSTVLQFAAKSQELVMQASIVEIILCIVRVGLVDSTVPFGALSGAIQPTQLSYLWSLDFFSIFKSPALQGWRKMIFVIAIPSLISLIALVGPSSAVLMIPRPETSRVVPGYPSTFKGYLNESEGSLYPSHVGQAQDLDLDLANLNLTALFARLEKTTGTGLRANNTYETVFQGIVYPSMKTFDEPDRLLLLSNSETGVNATIPTEVVPTAYSYFFQDGLNVTYSVEATLPVVCTQEWSLKGNPGVDSKTILYYYKDDMRSLEPLFEISQMVKEVSGLVEMDYQPPDYQAQVPNQTFIYFNPIWKPSPEPGSNSWLGVMLYGYTIGIAQPTRNASSLLQWLLNERKGEARVTLRVKVITLNAHWNTDTMQLANRGKLRRAILRPNQSSLSRKIGTRPITLDLTAARSIHSATFVRVMASIGVPIAAAFVMMLSKVPLQHLESRRTLFETSYPNITYDENYLKDHQNLFHTSPTPNMPSNEATLNFVATQYGYGYASRSTSVYLSMTVMLVYCVIAISYVSYTLVTGSTSTAWNSGAELVALALQSRKPGHLGHTGVGIDSIKTYSEGVGIRVNTENELELVFVRDRDFDKAGLQKLEKRTAY